MTFASEGLPEGVSLDPSTGQITGSLRSVGTNVVTLIARNSKGEAKKPFRIVVGEQIALTPVMGWNSWNCWHGGVDQEKILRSANALKAAGLDQHGWSFVNIDDAWQGDRTGKNNAIQANNKFPDIKGMVDRIHSMGLKAGIYSTPWVVAYSKFPGGSSDTPEGAWTKSMSTETNYRLGKHSFAIADANQWAAWGFDYLKYDWRPNDVPHTAEMSKALRKSGRDIVFSLSNTAPLDHATDWARWANSWRTTCDIIDLWDKGDETYQYGVSQIGFSQDQWAPYAGPGHWNDADMLEVGNKGLTLAESRAHFSLWCIIAAPLIAGNDIRHMSKEVHDILTDKDVIAIDQDSLGKEGWRFRAETGREIWVRELAGNELAICVLNTGATAADMTTDWSAISVLKGDYTVRDVWAKKDLGTTRTPRTDHVESHDVMLFRLTPVK